MSSSRVGVERLEAICNASPDGILIVDSDGRITFANERVSDLFGYDPEELRGESVEVLVPEEYRETHVAQRDAYLADPVTRPMGAQLDLAVSCKDGSQVPVDIKLSPIEGDGGLEVMAAIRDVTEQVALEKKYRTILGTAPDAGFVADAATGEITEVNQQATELLGYTEEELVGMRQVELHPSGESDRYRQLFEEHVDRGRAVFSRFPDGSDILVETVDGDRIPVEINAQVFELGDRRLITGVFRDVSDQREYERRLEREIDRLEDLASILSHDVRSPLGVAEGYTELVQETGDVSKLDRVSRAQERVRGIIESVLEMIDKGQSIGEASLAPIDLEEHARRSWQMTNTNGSTLVVEESVSFLADRDRISHVFENLFRNAIEHGGEQVTVTVGQLDDEPGFFVEDDGPGIPEDRRETVFEPRYTTSEDGTGFGLAIVKEIASAHGWSVSVTESSDGGARFEFTGISAA